MLLKRTKRGSVNKRFVSVEIHRSRRLLQGGLRVFLLEGPEQTES